MKKSILILILILSSLTFSEVIIPKNVQEEIRREAVEIFGSASGDEKMDYYDMQSGAYIEIEEKLAASTLTEGEKTAIKQRLRKMYGSNYIKQTKELNEEMNYVVTISKEQKREKEEVKKIESSKEELKTIVQENKELIPEKIMKKFKDDSERLYPGKHYEQKIYMEAAISGYKSAK